MTVFLIVVGVIVLQFALAVAVGKFIKRRSGDERLDCVCQGDCPLAGCPRNEEGRP